MRQTPGARVLRGRGVIVPITERVTALLLETSRRAERPPSPPPAPASPPTRGQIVLGEAARVDLWSRDTRSLLRRFFPSDARRPCRLPVAIESPLLRLLSSPPSHDGRPAACGHRFVFRRRGEVLRVRVVQHARTGRLILELSTSRDTNDA